MCSEKKGATRNAPQDVQPKIRKICFPKCIRMPTTTNTLLCMTLLNVQNNKTTTTTMCLTATQGEGCTRLTFARLRLSGMVSLRKKPQPSFVSLQVSRLHTMSSIRLQRLANGTLFCRVACSEPMLKSCAVRRCQGVGPRYLHGCLLAEDMTSPCAGRSLFVGRIQLFTLYLVRYL